MVTECLTHSCLWTVYTGIVAVPSDVCRISSSTLVSAFVVSKTNSLPLLSGCPLYLLSTLQKVQNSAAKLAFIITPVLLNTLVGCRTQWKLNFRKTGWMVYYCCCCFEKQLRLNWSSITDSVLAGCSHSRLDERFVVAVVVLKNSWD